MKDIKIIKYEINKKINDKEIFNSLLQTTFKGLEQQIAKRAMLDGALRGFKFEDFLEKNVYAIPFKGEYSLVTSIDYARKIGMKSGVVGKSEPKFVFDKDGNVESCTITIKRKVDNYVGDYSATVFFDEYYKPPFKKNGYEIKSLWDTKPKTMIAKVAEMHALRMACPEELAQAYIEEDYQAEEKVIDVIEENVKEEVAKIKTEEELKKYYEANKGKGKEFDKLIMNRKNEIKENAKTKTKNS